MSRPVSTPFAATVFGAAIVASTACGGERLDVGSDSRSVARADPCDLPAGPDNPFEGSPNAQIQTARARLGGRWRLCPGAAGGGPLGYDAFEIGAERVVHELTKQGTAYYASGRSTPFEYGWSLRYGTILMNVGTGDQVILAFERDPERLVCKSLAPEGAFVARYARLP